MPIGERPGSRWHALFARLDELTAPLLAAGWQLTNRDSASMDAGYVVVSELQRDGVRLSVELFEPGDLCIWIAGVDDDRADDDDPEPPAVEVTAADVERAVAAYAAYGWL